MSDLIASIDDRIEAKSLLKHPFYQKWTEGSLNIESLAGYSQEYFHLTKAVPGFVGSIISHAPAGTETSTMEEVRNEETEHITLWTKFASSLGVSETALESSVKPKTIKAVNNLQSLMSGFEAGACAMYAFEKEIPKISHTKLDGLQEFYGITTDDATEYFRVHTEADIRHAAVWSHIIKDSAQPETMLEISDASLDAQNLLLDSCYESYC